MTTPQLPWTPSRHAPLAWRAARRIGNDAARAALAAGVDAARAWASLPEHEAARAALDAGTVDLAGIVTRAIGAARALDPKSTLVAELATAHEKRDLRALMTLAPRAHAALAAGKLSRAATWATDAALLAATGEQEDATYAALEALREAHEAGAPGSVERWADVRAIADAFDPYALIELVTEDLPAEQVTSGRRFVGFRTLSADLDNETAIRALRIVVGDCDDAETVAACASRIPGVIASFGDVRFVAVPQLWHAGAWERWIEAEHAAGGLRWRTLRGALSPRLEPEKTAFYEAVEAALEAVAAGPWARAWSSASKVLNRYQLIGLGNERDADGWRWSLRGDPNDLERRFRVMRR